MTRTEAKDFIKHQEPIFLQRAKKSGYICPICGNGSGKDGDGIVLDKKDPTHSHYKCFVCGEYADVIDLVGSCFGIPKDDWKAKFEKAFEIYGLSVTSDETSDAAFFSKGQSLEEKSTSEEDLAAFFQTAAAHNDFVYLMSRGISKDTQKRFGIGFVMDWISPKAIQTTIEKGGDPSKLPRSPRCIIPTGKGSYIARDTRADLSDEQKRYSKMKQGETRIFNLKALEKAEVVFVTEGEIDALSIEEAGGFSVGLGSTSMYRAFVEQLEKNYNGQVFVLALDNDEPGRAAMQQLSEALEDIGVCFIDGSSYAQGIYKDPNEALVGDSEAFMREIRSLQEKAKKRKTEYRMVEYRASDMLDYFRNIGEQPEVMEASTGFEELDEKLNGGLHEGLYVIGSISSLGKTTFMLQLADQIAANGQDVLYFSLEMSRYELMAKSISRNTYVIAGRKKSDENGHLLAKNTEQILNNRKYKNYSSDEKAVIEKAIDAYSLQAEHLYIYEGRYKGARLSSRHIREITMQHRKKTGNTPIVMVDYLQILAPMDKMATDKQNTDAAVFELKELSRELNTAVIAISSFNRDNYTEPVNMASFKESGAVEYSSDVLLGLQYAGMDYRPDETERKRTERLRELVEDAYQKKQEGKPIEVELKCLKYRNGCQFSLKFDMLAVYNHFSVKTDDQLVIRGFGGKEYKII